MCNIDGCTGVHEAKGFCVKHYQRLRRTGDPLATKRMGRPLLDDQNYVAVHQRLYRVRGSASDQQCVKCDGPALHWCLRWDRASEVLDGFSSHGGAVQFSSNLEDYDPMCVSCHRNFDLSREK